MNDNDVLIVMTDKDRWGGMSEEERESAKHSVFGTYWSEIEKAYDREDEE